VAAALVLGGLVALVALLIVGHALLGRQGSPAEAALLDETRAALLESLEGAPGDAAAASASLARLPRDLRIRVLGDLAASLGGTGRDRLTELARQTGLLSAAETLCAAAGGGGASRGYAS